MLPRLRARHRTTWNVLVSSLFVVMLGAKDADYSDLVVTILNPTDGSSGHTLPIYPSIDMAAAGSGPIADRFLKSTHLLLYMEVVAHSSIVPFS
jgi:hypothetical protein